MRELPAPGLRRAIVVVLSVAGALTLVVLGAVGVTLLRSEDAEPVAPPAAEPADDLPDPADPVDDLVDAAEDRDCAEAGVVMTDELLATRPCTSSAWRVLGREDVDVSLGSAVIVDDRATVPAAVVAEDEDDPVPTSHLTFTLHPAGEDWKVASIAHGDVRAAEPADVLDAFFRAVFDGDCELATTYATPDYLDRQGECMATGLGEEELSAVVWEFGEVRHDGGRRAVVPATLTNGDDVSTGDWELVVRQREWRVHRLPE